MTVVPARGEVWLADLEPTRGHEQGGRRPAVIVSTQALNRSRARLVIALPLTTRERPLPTRVRVEPPDGGVRETSFICCEHIRTLSTERLSPQPFGSVSLAILDQVDEILQLLLGL
ncbi:MAG: transcriptional modulator of MazE/toxin, MazF [Chloroflexi bacterium]|nr:transcriptional modulator of MazE/toxin, MazF [Chloroflexota bacterium]